MTLLEHYISKGNYTEQFIDWVIENHSNPLRKSFDIAVSNKILGEYSLLLLISNNDTGVIPFNSNLIK